MRWSFIAIAKQIKPTKKNYTLKYIILYKWESFTNQFNTDFDFKWIIFLHIHFESVILKMMSERPKPIGGAQLPIQ